MPPRASGEVCEGRGGDQILQAHSPEMNRLDLGVLPRHYDIAGEDGAKNSTQLMHWFEFTR